MSISDKLQTIAENLQIVNNLNEELEQTLYGTDTGGKSYYDEFWDLYQENGNRKDYTNCFSGVGWNNNTFKPKYDIVAKIPIRMFAYSGIEGNLVQLLKDLGITMTVDIGQGRQGVWMLQGSKITHFPDIIMGDAYSYADLLRDGSFLTDVRLLDIRSDRGFGNNCFYGCTALKNITFEGNIGQDIYLQYSPSLSKASIESLINALWSGATGKTATLKKKAVDTEFETAEGLADGSTSAEWTTLIATKSNWTISLV
jgi:hypothetical protein